MALEKGNIFLRLRESSEERQALCSSNVNGGILSPSSEPTFLSIDPSETDEIAFNDKNRLNESFDVSSDSYTTPMFSSNPKSMLEVAIETQELESKGILRKHSRTSEAHFDEEIRKHAEANGMYSISIFEGPSAEVQALRTTSFRRFLYALMILFTGGIIWVLCLWFPQLKRMILFIDENDLSKANMVFIKNSWKQVSLQKLITVKSSLLERRIHYFEYHSLRFVYVPMRDTFINWGEVFHDKFTVKELSDTEVGISKHTFEVRKQIYGVNSLDVEEKTYLDTFLEEVLHPFFVFQMLSISFWLADEYVQYASAILITSIISLLVTLISTKRNERRLKEMTKCKFDAIVLRDNQWITLDSSLLVPGDIIKITEDMKTFFCDLILLHGECVVDESMLTGESVPVSKSSILQNVVVDDSENSYVTLKKNNILFCGTNIMQTKPSKDGRVWAIVQSTGFNTTKGQLFRSIIHPQPHSFKLYIDSMKFVGVLGIFGVSGFIFTSIRYALNGIPLKQIFFSSFDLITIVVPPALPVTMTVGMNIAVNRLLKKNIFCISPQRVNVAGKVNFLIFDKTGTLTEDHLILDNVRQVSNGKLSTCTLESEGKDSLRNDRLSLSQILASCHEIREINGVWHGDPLDLEILRFSGWNYFENLDSELHGAEDFIGMCVPSDENVRLPNVFVIRRFEFSSDLKRMSVIVKIENDYFIISKGAPEILRMFCISESVPSDFDYHLDEYTQNGYRVIGCAYKKLENIRPEDIVQLKRVDLERDLCFSGVVIFENKLKPETSSAIQTFNKAKLQTIMATGDNILTGIFVARESGMIPLDLPVFYSKDASDDIMQTEFFLAAHCSSKTERFLFSDFAFSSENLPNNVVLAITGGFYLRARDELDLDIYHKMLKSTLVFARQSPNTKRLLVEDFQSIGYTVLMCGDGTNDCGALKTADVGVSLSESESSVAAPFTSKIKNISCVNVLLSEGRAAMVTSISCFKYMGLYSLIQFTSVTLLYTVTQSLSDPQFLYVDLFVVLPLSFVMAYTEAIPELSSKHPASELMSSPVISSLVGQFFIQFGVQLFTLYHIRNQDFWYEAKPLINGEGATTETVSSFENTALITVSCFMYIFLSWVLAIGPPFRKRLMSNLWFLFLFFGLTIWSANWLFLQWDWIAHQMKTVLIPSSYRLTLLIFVCVWTLVSVVWETISNVLIPVIWSRYRSRSGCSRSDCISSSPISNYSIL